MGRHRLLASLSIALLLVAAGLVRAGAAPAITYVRRVVATVDQSAEPGIRVDPTTGTVFVVSPVASTQLWSSSDDGTTWRRAGSTRGGGGDSDLAIDSDGVLYAVEPLAAGGVLSTTIPVSVSRDHGRTFGRPHPLDPTASGVKWDRPWITAFGHGHVVVTARNTSGPSEAWVSANGAQTFAGPFAIAANPIIGGPLLSTAGGRLYTAYAELDSSGAIAVRLATSVDGVQWQRTTVARALDPSPVFFYDVERFPVVAIDQAGRLFVAFSVCETPGVAAEINCQVLAANSTDGGGTWSIPETVSQAGHSAIYPWIVAGRAGHADLVFYQANQALGPDLGPDLGTAATTWNVVMAQTSDGGATWTSSMAARAFHTGSICTQGVSCAGQTGVGNVPLPFDRRDLDFFAVASDQAGNAMIAYPKDRPPAGIDAALVRVDLTVAKQASGPRL